MNCVLSNCNGSVMWSLLRTFTWVMIRL